MSDKGVELGMSPDYALIFLFISRSMPLEYFIRKVLGTAVLLFLAFSPLAAQTPIANRVAAASKMVSKSSVQVAAYKDAVRHGLYYIYQHRLYFYDVLTNRTTNITFSTSSYDKILSSWLSPDGNFFYIVIDRGGMVSNYMDGGQELWRYDSRTRRYIRIGQGFAIRHNKNYIWIKRATRCLNPSAPRPQRRWMAQDHYYDAYGKTIWAKDEYEVKSSQMPKHHKLY